MAIARKIAYNVLFNVVAKIVSTALALVIIGFITRYLGTEGFGEYSIVIAFFSFFGAIADLGLYVITAREISRPNADEAKIIKNVFALRLTSALIVLLISPLIVFFLPYPIEVKLGILVAAASFVFSSSYGVLNGVFQKNLSMDRVGIAETVGKIVQLLIVFFAVKYNLGFMAVIASLFFSMLANFSLIMFFIRPYAKIGLEFDFVYWRKFLSNSLPMGISAIITFLYFKLDTILLSVLQTSSDVGIYNAAYKVIENLTFFPAMIVGLVLPIMSASVFSDKKRFSYISNETATVFLIIIVPLIVGSLFLSDNIIALIGGGQFHEAANVLRILIFSLAFIFFGNLFNNILIAANLQKKLMQVLWLCAFLNIALNLFLIPRFSYIGAAWSSVLTEMLVALIGLTLAKKNLGYFPKIRNLTRIIFAGFLMALFLFVFSQKSFIILFLGSSLSYVVSLWLVRAVTVSEIKSIFFNKKPGFNE